MATLTTLAAISSVQNSLIEDAAGDLFGTTTFGGASSDGSVFELARTGAGFASTPTTLVNFDGDDGTGPTGGLLADASGNLFGVTGYGGPSGGGVVYEIAKTSTGYASTPTTLASFGDRAYPSGPLTEDAAGDLFGATVGGGDSGDGSVFEIAKTATGYASATTLVSFDGADGARPYYGVTIDASGNLFGTGAQGGSSNDGVVFEIPRTDTGYASAPTLLATFNGANGDTPYSGLVEDAAGDLFGATFSGGPNFPGGTVFEIARSGAGYGALTTLAYPRFPNGNLLIDAYGDLYGASDGNGPIFEIPITASGYAAAATSLATFSSDAGAQGSLISDSAGNLFGVTFGGTGGSENAGTVFELTGAGFDFPNLTIAGPGGATNQPQQTISGTVDFPDAGRTISIYDGSTLVGTAQATDSGAWSASVSLTPAQGQHVVTAQVTNTLGNIGVSDAVAFNLDTIAPALTITNPGGPTDLTQQTVAGTIDALDAGLTVSVYDGAKLVGTTRPDANGNWSAAVTLFSDQGTQTLTAEATDAVGNVGTSNAVAFTLTSIPLFGSYAYTADSPGGEIYALYDGILGQPPGPVDLENSAAAAQAGVSIESIAQGIIQSSAYTSQFGSYAQSSDSAFVTTLYETALSRQPDQSGLQSWTDALANGETRAAVALGIALSPEARSDLQSTFAAGVFVPSQPDSEVARLYYGLLDRSPDAPGLQSYETDLANGASLSDIARDILSSAEYVQNTEAGRENANFVDDLYGSALGRAPDSAGAQMWTTALDVGAASPADVVLGVLSSPEFQSDSAGDNAATYVNVVYEAALGRQVDPLGLQYWEGALSNGLSRTAFDAAIIGSPEFQSARATPVVQAFVNTLYQGAEARIPEAGQPWTAALMQGGLSNVQAALDIAESPAASAFLAPKIESGLLISGRQG